MSLQTYSFKVENPGVRFDQFLGLQFPAVSMTRLRNAIKSGDALLNRRKTMPGWILQPGDDVEIQLDPGEPTAAMAENIPLEIIFEDEDLIIINKPVNLLSHPSSNEKSGTVMNALAYYFLHSPSRKGSAPLRPILLHRLDRDTSGVLAIAKNERAGRIVSKAFRDRKVKKRYLALVSGVIAGDEGGINAPIARQKATWPRWGVMEGGEPAQTLFTVRQRFRNHTLLELEPLTGKTHQLRIHCAYIGHAIVGDQVYKTPEMHEIPGLNPRHQMLHAHMLAFRLPSNGEETTFIAPLPKVMTDAIELLAFTM